MSTEKNLFTYQTAAKYLSISAITLKRWKAAGYVGYIQRGPRKIYFTIEQLDNVSQVHEPTGVAV